MKYPLENITHHKVHSFPRDGIRYVTLAVSVDENPDGDVEVENSNTVPPSNPHKVRKRNLNDRMTGLLHVGFSVLMLFLNLGHNAELTRGGQFDEPLKFGPSP